MISTIGKNWQVETLRVGIYLISLVLILLIFFFQSPFISWEILGPSYLSVCLGFVLHLILFLKIEKFSESSKFLLGTFVIDSLLISYFIYNSGSYQTLFLLLHVLNIIFCSLIYKGAGALIIALVTSISYSGILIFGPEYKNFNLLLLLGINNLSFFGIAGLSGYLSERLFRAEEKNEEKDVKIKSLEDLHELIIDKIPVSLLTLDTESTVIQMNTKALLNFPLIKDNAKFIEFFSPIQPYWEKIRLLTSGDEWTQEITHNKNEETKFFKVTATPMSKKDSLILLLIEDLTEMKRMEFHLKQKEKLAAVGSLAAGVAHEIRNPLAGISGSVEMLSQTTENDDDKKLMKIILKEIDRLNNLISEFLDYAKPEKPPTEFCNLVEIINDVVKNAHLNATLRKDIKIQLNLPESVLIIGYKNKLTQAFLNIIINAFQAMEKAKDPELIIRLVKQGNQYVLRVKDNGSGMTDETKKRIFEPFYTTKSKGTGLGLAITHKIFESHNVKFELYSEPDLGSEFVFYFPCVAGLDK